MPKLTYLYPVSWEDASDSVGDDITGRVIWACQVGKQTQDITGKRTVAITYLLYTLAKSANRNTNSQSRNASL